MNSVRPRGGDVRGYLDIETTGLSPRYGQLTVIGLFLEDGEKGEMLQWVGDGISRQRLLEAVDGLDVLYTYNGRRFDLPYIKAKLGLDLARRCLHRDLMYDCWRRRLYGGLKEVEKRLGIPRELSGLDGWMAVRLWRDYQLYGDQGSLALLLRYNQEDVLNLKALRLKLEV